MALPRALGGPDGRAPCKAPGTRRVAERLAEEARQRQVVVFTHDIIFFNELCGAAESRGIEPVTIALEPYAPDRFA